MSTHVTEWTRFGHSRSSARANPWPAMIQKPKLPSRPCYGIDLRKKLTLRDQQLGQVECCTRARHTVYLWLVVSSKILAVQSCKIRTSRVYRAGEKKIAQAGRRNFAWMRGRPPDTVPPSPWMVQTGGLNLSIYLSLLTDFCHRFRTIHTIPFSLRLQYCTKVSSSPIMYLTKFFALFMASIAAVAPSIEYSQLSVKVTGTATQNRGSVEHFSQGWIQMVESRCSIYHSTSPWERTLSSRVGALQVSWPTLRVSAPRRLSRHQVHFSRGKAIVDHHFALGHHPALLYPRWPSLWPLGKYSPIFDLVVLLETSGWKPRYFLEFADQSKLNLVSSVSFVSLFLIYSISTNVNRWILFL